MPSIDLRKQLIGLATGAVWVMDPLASGALAQSPQQLPEIVVQGATLQTPPRPKSSQPAAAPAPQGAPAAAESAGVAAAASDGQSAVDGGFPAVELGTAVTVVTGDELRRRQVQDAADALRSLPGVSVTRNSTSASVTEVRLRGAEGNHTLVLIDGVVANTPTNGSFDFSDLSVENIERIEVIRGPHSVIYGTGAVGGVINIVTRGGPGPARLAWRTEAGSFGTRDIGVSLSGGTERAWGGLSYHLRQSDGFNISPFGNERDASRLATFAARGGVAVAPGLTVDGMVRHASKTGDRDGFGGPVGQLATALDDASTFTSEVLLAGVNVRWDTLDGRLTHHLRTSYNFTRTTDTDLLFPAFPFFSEYESETRTYAYSLTYQLPSAAHFMRHSITGLVEKEEESFTPLGDLTDRLTRDRGRLAVAGEYRAAFAERLFVTAGLRHDDNSAFDDFTSWRTSVSWLAGFGIRPHASVGTGFKVPTFFEQFGRIPGLFFFPNPNLVPERSFGWDAGVEFTFWQDRAVVDVTYFNADLEDKISRNPAAADPTLINLPGTSTREGVEVSAALKLAPGIRLGAAYTYLDARDSTGLREVRRPPHAGRVDLDVDFAAGRGRLHLSAAYNGRMDDLGFRVIDIFGSTTPELVGLDDYWLLSAAASYKLYDNLEVFARVENLLNARYQEVYGYETPDIAGYVGMRITFEQASMDAGLPPR